MINGSRVSNRNYRLSYVYRIEKKCISTKQNRVNLITVYNFMINQRAGCVKHLWYSNIYNIHIIIVVQFRNLYLGSWHKFNKKSIQKFRIRSYISFRVRMNYLINEWIPTLVIWVEPISCYTTVFKFNENTSNFLLFINKFVFWFVKHNAQYILFNLNILKKYIYHI